MGSDLKCTQSLSQFIILQRYILKKLKHNTLTLNLRHHIPVYRKIYLPSNCKDIYVFSTTSVFYTSYKKYTYKNL